MVLKLVSHVGNFRRRNKLSLQYSITVHRKKIKSKFDSVNIAVFVQQIKELVHRAVFCYLISITELIKNFKSLTGENTYF